MTSIGRTRTTAGAAVAALVVLAVAGGCAEPGQLGHDPGPGSATTPEAGAAGDRAPGDPAAPQEPGAPRAPGAPQDPGAAQAPGSPQGPGAAQTPGAAQGPGAAPGPGAPPGGPQPPVAPQDPAAAQVPGAGVSGVPGVPASAAGSDVRGSVEQPVRVDTPGRSEFLVRTEVLQPGQATGWISHPGTVLSVVRSGSVTVVRQKACEPARFGPNQGFFLADGEPNQLRNDGQEAVVLTRSEVLAPNSDERRPAEPGCPTP